MSDLVISSNLAAMIPSAQSDEQLAQVLPTPATTQRLFTSADTLRVFAEVYDNQVQTPHEVDISTTLRATDSQVVFRAEEQRSTDELQNTPGGYGHIVEIPLAEVAPGDYLLRVEAQSRLGETEAVAREILVHVVAPALLPTEATATAPSGPCASRIPNSLAEYRIEATLRGAWHLAYDNRGAQPRVVEGPHAVDLRRRTHGGPCRAEQCPLDPPLPGLGPAPSGGLTTNSRRTGQVASTGASTTRSGRSRDWAGSRPPSTPSGWSRNAVQSPSDSKPKCY